MATEITNNSGFTDFTLESLSTPSGINQLNSILQQITNNIAGNTDTVRVFTGLGTPEAAVAAGVGSLYMRTDGSADTSVYRKESGSGNTGWVAIKSPASLPLSVANGGTGADNSAVAQGYIPYMSATGVISWLAVGTSGQFLKTQGASANPIWSSTLSNYAAGSYPISKPTRFYTGTDTSYTKVGEILIPRGGTLTVKYFGNVNGGPNPVGHVRIYRNGSAVGTERNLGQSAGGDPPTFYSEDISGWSTGDLCQLYARIVAGDATSYDAGDMQLFENVPAIESVNTTYNPVIHFGIGVPNTVLGSQGDLYLRTDGGATTTLYVKTGATTWTAK